MPKKNIVNNKKKTKKIRNINTSPGLNRRDGGLMLVSAPKKKRSGKKNAGFKLSDIPRFHPCSAKYLAALSDPWSPEANGSCVPIGDATLTHKARYFARFTVAVGTAGVGFALINPCLANDVPGIFYSTVGFTGSIAQPYTSQSVLFPNVSSANFTNAPYALADFRPTTSVSGENAPDVLGRLVSVGVSSEYTGTVMNMSGLLYSLVEPAHGNLCLAGAADLAAYPNTLITRVTDKRVFTVAHGINQAELDFCNQAAFGDVSQASMNAYNPLIFPYAPDVPLQNFASGNPTSEPGAPILLMWVLPATAAGSTFNVEVVVHAEFKGRKTASSLSESHSDEQGARMILAASGVAREIQQAEKCDWACAMANSLSKVIKSHGPSVLRLGTKTVSSMIKRFSML